jgi:DNA-binding NtrC family response regulator
MNMSANVHVLLIDDDQGTMDLLKEVLQKAGYAVDEAKSGQEALAQARAFPFDVVLADLRVKSGKFREDLFYRLGVVTIALPRLSERREDIPLLALHFLGKYASEAGQGLSHIAPEAMALLCQYNWPGNVRELEHVIERAVALTADPILLVEDLPAKLQGPAPTSDVFPSLDEMEKRHLQLALKKTAGNRRQAAMLLGVSRRTLYRMAKRHGLISENIHE